MVRLVFRSHTQVRRTICTSVSLRASTRVSSGFALLKHSSPSFGSHHVCSNAVRSEERPVDGAAVDPRKGEAASHLSLSFRMWVLRPNTRIHVRLLGPCYKTGQMTPFRQRSRRAHCAASPQSDWKEALRADAKLRRRQVRRHTHRGGRRSGSPRRGGEGYSGQTDVCGRKL